MAEATTGSTSHDQAGRAELPKVHLTASPFHDLCSAIPGLSGACGLARSSAAEDKRQRHCAPGFLLELASPRKQSGPALRLVPTNGCVVSSAAMLTSGWLTAATIASIGSAAGLPFVGLGAGCVYGSLGLMYLAYSMIKGATRFPPHAPSEDTAEGSEYPMPNWLDTRLLNWGVAGCVGVGKSSLVNALRGVSTREVGSAAVGIGHTTWRPEPYTLTGGESFRKDFPEVEPVLLWDLPGAGTVDWPYDSYVQKAGLRYFDGIVFVMSDAYLENEVELLRQLRKFGVPHFLVRSKIDQDVQNNAQDFGATPEETLAEVRKELLKSGCESARSYLVSVKRRNQTDTGFDALLAALSTEVSRQKEELLGIPSTDHATGWAARIAAGRAAACTSPAPAAVAVADVVDNNSARAVDVAESPVATSAGPAVPPLNLPAALPSDTVDVVTDTGIAAAAAAVSIGADHAVHADSGRGTCS